MSEKLVISRKGLKGEDGYKTFSVRLEDGTVDRLDIISKDSNRSRNEVISILIDYALQNCEVK